VITTHFHGDHVGGLPELATRIPIQEFIDHGPNVQPGGAIDAVMQQYAALNAKVKHRVVKAGDRIDMKDLDWRIVSAGGQVISAPLPGGGGPNPYCASFKRHDVNPVSADFAIDQIERANEDAERRHAGCLRFSRRAWPSARRRWRIHQATSA